MKEVIKSYKKSKLIQNISIVFASFALAIGINVFVIDGTDIGKNLTASVINNKANSTQSDIYFKIDNNKAILYTSKPITNIQNFSVSVNYNPEGLKINDIKSGKNEIIKIGENPGNLSLIVNFSGKTNMYSGDEILTLDLEKLVDENQNINIVNANFSDVSGENYILSTSGINF